MAGTADSRRNTAESSAKKFRDDLSNSFRILPLYNICLPFLERAGTGTAKIIQYRKV